MTIFLKFFIIVCFFPSMGWAGTGKTIIPHWKGYQWQPHYDKNKPHDDRTLQEIKKQGMIIYLSNITSHSLNVNVTFFEQDGTIFSESKYIGFSWQDSRIEAHSTAKVVVLPEGLKYGYAVIEWQNLEGDNDSVGLVAYAVKLIREGKRKNKIEKPLPPVNSGLPF